MRLRPQILPAVTIGLLVLGTTGCSSIDGGAWAPPAEQEEQQGPRYAPPLYVEPTYEPLPAPPPRATWRCSYSPTYDYDWHNDVLCSNGSETVRPYFREWDSFVTEAEIMESAREYERQLNDR